MSIDTGQQTIHIGKSGNRGGHGSIGLSGRRGIKGDVLNCCGKMPSLRRAGLPESSNLPKQLRISPLSTLSPLPTRTAIRQKLNQRLPEAGPFLGLLADTSAVVRPGWSSPDHPSQVDQGCPLLLWWAAHR